MNMDIKLNMNTRSNTSVQMIADFDGDASMLMEEQPAGDYPILTTRNIVMFPTVLTPILVGRTPSLNLLKRLENHPGEVFTVFSQKDSNVDDPGMKDLYPVGVFARLIKVIDMPTQPGTTSKTAIIQGLGRCTLADLKRKRPYYMGTVEPRDEEFPAEGDKEFDSVIELLRSTTHDYIANNENIPNESEYALSNIQNKVMLVNYICGNMPFPVKDKFKLLKQDAILARAYETLKIENRELEFFKIQNNIRQKTHFDIDEQQKEYFLQQQMKNIKEELGGSTGSPERAELTKKALTKKWPEAIADTFNKEMDKLDTLNPQSPDYSIQLNYLQTMVALPWGECSKDDLNLTRAAKVLDPEQNNAFHDNYLDVDYDLSKVLFVATANDLNTIPRPLLDRMEVIEVSGYITEEKTEIARRHLVPRELDATGLDKVTPKIKFSKPALEKIIEQYTRESGVRQLEKQINKALRKIAYRKAMDSSLEIPNITPAELEDLLGKPPFYRDIYQGNAYAGVVTGLAWTSVGGEILFIETSLSKGKAGKLTLTGNLGEVMKESAVIALEYVKAHIDKLGVDYRIFDQWNIHIHVPEGATPKDGPSAGITIATSIASALTQRKVRKNTAMTGEITLRGKVLPVGGIKEKILAAKRAGITDIVMCRDNRKDIEEIPEEYRKGVEFHYVENVQDVWDFVLTDELVDNPVDLTVKEEETKGEKEGAK